MPLKPTAAGPAPDRPGLYGFFLVCLFVFLLRYPYSSLSVIDWDESVYFTVSQNILHGGVPYQTAWDNKGPLLYFLFVPVLGLFGTSIVALRLFTTLWLLGSMFLVFLIARRQLPGGISWVPSLVYGLFFSARALGGLASNGEIFMMLPVIAGIYFFIKTIFLQPEVRRGRLFLSGLFCGAALMIKVTSLFCFMVIPVWLVGEAIAGPGRSRKVCVAGCLTYTIGCCVPIILFAVYFLWHGAWSDFFHGWIVFNKYWSVAIPFQTGSRLTLDVLRELFWTKPEPVAVLAGLGFIGTLCRGDFRSPERRPWIFFWAAAGFFCFAGIWLSRHAYKHYFLMMALPFAFWSGLAFKNETQGKAVFRKIGAVARLGVLAALLVSSVKDYGKPIAECPRLGEDDYRRIGAYICAHTLPKDTIFVLGGQPIVYLFAERKAPTKFFFWLYHWGHWQGALNTRSEAEPKLMEQRPLYFVYTPYDGKIDYLERMIAKDYRPEIAIGNTTLFRYTGPERK